MSNKYRTVKSGRSPKKINIVTHNVACQWKLSFPLSHNTEVKLNAESSTNTWHIGKSTQVLLSKSVMFKWEPAFTETWEMANLFLNPLQFQVVRSWYTNEEHNEVWDLHSIIVKPFISLVIKLQGSELWEMIE